MYLVTLLGGHHCNFTKIFGNREPELVPKAVMPHCLYYGLYSCYDRTLVCNRRMDARTDRRMDTGP